MSTRVIRVTRKLLLHIQISSREDVIIVASMVTKVNIFPIRRRESLHKGRVVGFVIRKGTVCSPARNLKRQKANMKRLIFF